MNKSNFYFTFAMNIMPATLLSVLPIGGLLLKNGTLPPTTFVLIVILSMGLITPIIGCMQFTDDLAKVSMEIFGKVYQANAGAAGPDMGAADAAPQDDVVDADYREVDDN